MDKIKMYEAEVGAKVGDALQEMYFRVAQGGCAVMKFNDVTITMHRKSADATVEVIREVSEL